MNHRAEELADLSRLVAENASLREENALWRAKVQELIAPHYIIDPDLRAQKFRDALASDMRLLQRKPRGKTCVSVLVVPLA